MADKNICDLVAKKMLAPIMEHGIPVDDATGMLLLEGIAVERFSEGFSYEEYQHQEKDFLGSYTPMSSPGTITLNTGRLKGIFWHAVATLHRAGYAFWREDFDKLAKLTVNKTYWHEHFHLFTDVQQHLVPGFKWDHLTEEALAVAYSWLRIEEERDKAISTTGRIAGSHYFGFLNILFDYKSPGYCDWRNYSARETFLDRLVHYINPPNTNKLLANGIPVHALLEAQLDKVLEFRKNEVLIWKGKKEVVGDV